MRHDIKLERIKDEELSQMVVAGNSTPQVIALGNVNGQTTREHSTRRLCSVYGLEPRVIRSRTVWLRS